jgi:hypothetical protein
MEQVEVVALRPRAYFARSVSMGSIRDADRAGM